jgi:hypothetical protein
VDPSETSPAVENRRDERPVRCSHDKEFGPTNIRPTVGPSRHPTGYPERVALPSSCSARPSPRHTRSRITQNGSPVLIAAD